jgi:hypothetical protein
MPTTTECYCDELPTSMNTVCHICKEEFSQWCASLDAQPVGDLKEAA